MSVSSIYRSLLALNPPHEFCLAIFQNIPNTTIPTMAKRKNKSKQKDHDALKKRSKKKNQSKPPIPVTILSGFLGSGKTTLLQNVLTSNEHGLRIAVIVNDMAALNVDGHTIRRISSNSSNNNSQHVTTTLSNGCICCELRGDLIHELERIRQDDTNEFDYVIIESTGIAEPQQVAESFCVDPNTMTVAHPSATESSSSPDDDTTSPSNENTNDTTNSKALFATTARLDTCVTVVDAVEFPKYLTSLQRFKDRFHDGIEEAQEGEAEKSIAELMVEQVEFANVILLNKMDLLQSNHNDGDQQLTTVKELIRQLNPRATIIPTSFGKLDDYGCILNTNSFSMKDAQQSPGWLTSLKDGVTAVTGEAEEYGIASHVFRARRPFHPLRLYQFVQQFACLAHAWNAFSSQERQEEFRGSTTQSSFTNNLGEILRSKGTCWIAGRDDSEMGWAHAGRILQVTPTAPWYCDTPPGEWPADEQERQTIQANMIIPDDPDDDESNGGDQQQQQQYPYGDRRQEIVFIGTGLQIPALDERLTKCLLTEQEMKHYSLHNLPIGAYPDPFPPEVLSCDSPRNLSLILRQGQNLHLEVVPDAVVTIHTVALHIMNEEHAVDQILAVKLWWDASDEMEHGTLVATLRPLSCEQYAPSLPILPRFVDQTSNNGTELEFTDESNSNVVIQRLRLQVIRSKSCTLSSDELMEAVQVHVQAQVEPLPYAEQQDDEENEAMDEHVNEEVNDEEEASVPTID